MKVHYDPEADAIYLRLDDSPIVESEEVRPGVVLDFDANDQIVGIDLVMAEVSVPGDRYSGKVTGSLG